MRFDVRSTCVRLAVLLAALGAAAPAPAREVRFGDVTIRALPDLPQSTTHGYHEFPFLITNESPVASRRVTLSGPGSIQAGMELNSLRTLARTLTLGPGSSARVALYQPPLPVFGSGLEVRIDGRLQRQTVPWSSGHPEYWVGMPGRHVVSGSGARAPRVLITQRLSEDGFPPHSDEDYRVIRAVVPVAAWSESWLAYSGFDGVVATAEDVEEMPAGVADALWRYVETGGSLTVLGRTGGGSGWRRSVAERAYAEVYEQGLEVGYAGFGAVLAAETASRVDALTRPQLERLEAAWQASRDPWDSARDPTGAHRQFPVAESVEVPVRGLFLLVFGFTLLIGPVNLALLTRKGKRTWLLWTVPVASLLTCAVVTASVLLGEGLVRVRRAEGLTLLDERARRATTLGWTGFYATLTPGDGLRFDPETEVTPILSFAYGQRGDAARGVEWGEDQHLARGWVRARLPATFIVRKSELRRERLSLARAADGSLEAVNGLGVDLESLWVADASGRLHVARGGLAAGAAGRLERMETTAAGGAGALRALYRGDLPNRLKRLEQEPAKVLRPGAYLAVAAAGAFIEDGLADVDRAHLKTVVYGLSAGEREAGR